MKHQTLQLKMASNSAKYRNLSCWKASLNIHRGKDIVTSPELG